VDVIVERCAGLDVGKDEVVACVRTPRPSGKGRRVQLRVFPTFTSSLEELADWLAANGVVEVVMEATGPYWKPIVRHEALFDRAELKGLRRWAVAAAR
jgi:transposase